MADGLLLGQNPMDGYGKQKDVLNFVFNKLMMDFDVCLPAKVLAYNRNANIATVQPLSKISLTNGQMFSRDDISQVPVLSIGGGGFHINFPLVPNDIGWLYACDRDISLILQHIKDAPEQPAATTRFHNFESGAMFVPDVYSKYSAITGADGAMVIRSVDGATQVAIFSDHINIVTPQTVTVKAGASVTIDTPTTTITGTLEVKGATTLDQTLLTKGDTTLAANATIAGGLAQGGGSPVAGKASLAGTLDVGGKITAPNATIGGSNVESHHHTAQGATAPTTGPQN